MGAWLTGLVGGALTHSSVTGLAGGALAVSVRGAGLGAGAVPTPAIGAATGTLTGPGEGLGAGAVPTSGAVPTAGAGAGLIGGVVGGLAPAPFFGDCFFELTRRASKLAYVVGLFLKAIIPTPEMRPTAWRMRCPTRLRSFVESGPAMRFCSCSLPISESDARKPVISARVAGPRPSAAASAGSAVARPTMPWSAAATDAYVFESTLCPTPYAMRTVSGALALVTILRTALTSE
jgi:hypothetical protein